MDIVQIAKDNYRRAIKITGDIQQPDNSNRWTLFRQDMQQKIESHSDITDAIAHAQTCGFDHRLPMSGNEAQTLFSRHCLVYEYPQYAESLDRFSDAEVSIPATIGRFRGGPLVSNVLFFHISYILAALSYNPKVQRICEIGGGYGGPARLWMMNPIRSIVNYTIVDLPESLFYADVFLRVAAPHLRIVYCTSPADFRNTAPQTIYLVPIHLAHLTTSMNFDLVTNTGSMAEISDDWIRYWTDWLERQRCNLFYSHNYFGIPVEKLFESRNIIAPLTPPGWHAARVRINPPLMLLQSFERNVAEAFFVRDSTDSNRRWIYEIMRLQQADVLTLRDLAYYLFNLPVLEQIDVAAEFRLFKKVLDDLHFAPKELVFLANRLIAAPTFQELPDNDRAFVTSALRTLEEVYAANYPQGRHAN